MKIFSYPSLQTLVMSVCITASVLFFQTFSFAEDADEIDADEVDADEIDAHHPSCIHSIINTLAGGLNRHGIMYRVDYSCKIKLYDSEKPVLAENHFLMGVGGFNNLALWQSEAWIKLAPVSIFIVEARYGFINAWSFMNVDTVHETYTIQEMSDRFFQRQDMRYENVHYFSTQGTFQFEFPMGNQWFAAFKNDALFYWFLADAPYYDYSTYLLHDRSVSYANKATITFRKTYKERQFFVGIIDEYRWVHTNQWKTHYLGAIFLAKDLRFFGTGNAMAAFIIHYWLFHQQENVGLKPEHRIGVQGAYQFRFDFSD